MGPRGAHNEMMTAHPSQTPQTPARLKAVSLVVAALAVAGLCIILLAPPFEQWTSIGTSLPALHLLLELFAIVIATLVVTVSWHTFDAHYMRSANLLIAGFLIVGVCDLVHALSYDGMPAFLGPSSTPRAIFFWLMGRSVEVITLGLLALGWQPRLSRNQSLAVGAGLSALLVWVGSYRLDWFPATFVAGEGVTPFKVGYEWALFALNLGVAGLLIRRARVDDPTRCYLLAQSSLLIGLGELAFTTYHAPSEFANIFGHIYKLAAYALLYLATFNSSIRAPFDALRDSEQRVRESELRLRSLSNNLPHCMVYQVVRELDGSMHFVHVSESVEQITGVKAQDVLRDASLLYDRFHPDDIPLIRAAEEHSARTLQVFDFVARWRGVHGQMQWMHFFSAPRRMSDGRIVWDGVQMDITHQRADEESRRTLESQLRESQKMEAIGTLAGGIAHDFNNVLGSILGNLALAQDHVRKGASEGALQSLEQVRKASVRARDLVQQILTFSRKRAQQLVSQPLRPLIEDSLSMLRATLPARVTLETALSDKPLHVLADATQIGQVVMNLCTNAWQALHGSTGRISVGLDEVTLQPEAAREMGGLPAGDYAHMWVSDEGVGIDSALRERIFEPFYTTKPVGEGTGLGLSVVHGIVRSHHGGLMVESKPGDGSTFHVYFPKAKPAAEPAGASPGTEAPGQGQGKHVLYVDDDDLMAVMVEQLLKREGYRVSCYRDPIAALSALREVPDSFDIVVSDFNMPVCSGLEVAKEVGAIRPSLPVVISSGYVTDELQAEASKLGVRALLQKQNTLEDMPMLLYQVLGTGTGKTAQSTRAE